MKKTIFLIPFLILAGCGSNSYVEVKEEVVETKTELETVYMGEEKAQFYMETPTGPIFLIPGMAKEETTLKSNNRFQEDAVAGEYSKFVVVGFVLDNQSKNTVTFFSSDIPNIYDSKDRQYTTSSEYTSNFYLPTAIAVLESKPGIPMQGYVVYEVAKDSEGFYMIAGDGTVKILLQEKE